ncbi:MAG: hypothetical protein U0263_20045 [Polyangiaceae bacterium]
MSESESPASIPPVSWQASEDPPVVPLYPRRPLWHWALLSTAALLVLFSVLSSGATPASGNQQALGALVQTSHDLVPALTQTSLALDGEENALNRLLAKPAAERSVTEVIALSAGQRELGERQLSDLGDEVRRDPEALRDPTHRRRLYAFARDPELGARALGLLATAASSDGPDLVYAVWATTRKQNPVNEVAGQLLATEELRARASLPLALALSLAAIRDCEAARTLVGAAIDSGDRRSLRGLARLAQRTGCGQDGRADCFPCLRSGKDLSRALRAVATRRAPLP